MKKLVAVLLGLALIAAPVMPAHAREHVFVGFGYGGGYYPYGAYPYPAYPYPAYYSPYYVAAPPVMYVPATVPPPVVAPITYAPPPAPVVQTPVIVDQATINANQTSPTFIDGAGRTCRHFQATNGGPAYGTACLMSDGSWRTVQ